MASSPETSPTASSGGLLAMPMFWLTLGVACVAGLAVGALLTDSGRAMLFSEEPAPAEPGAPPFNQTAAATGLEGAAQQARQCFSGSSTPVQGKLSVTFSFNGQVQDVSASGDLASAEQFECVKQAYEATRVPSYSGAVAVVKKTFEFAP